MITRPYQHERDASDAARIYREVGWISAPAHETATERLGAISHGWVAEVDGHVECLALSVPGQLRYGEADLPMCAVAGVTTSRLVRRQGLATGLTARLLADGVAAGQVVAMLGVFDQGYYDRLGFGTGSSGHHYVFDPAALRVPGKPSVPVRLGVDDWQAMHESRLARRRMHGACSLLPPSVTHVDALWAEHGFGLGYLDASGNLSHHFWCATKGEHGPYHVEWMAYRTRDQFLELLGLLRNLGDQVHSVALREPPDVCLQDLLRQPFRLRRLTERSPHANRVTASAGWQVRILDLERCVTAVCNDAPPLQFNLVLTDPVAAMLPDESAWKGTAGEYAVTVGAESSVESAARPDWPTARASINAFSRLWLGVASATSLSWTDDFVAPAPLLAALDRAFRLPVPLPDWEF